MKVRAVKRPTTKKTISQEQLARIIYRTMKIERSTMTKRLASQAAAKIRYAR